MIRISSRAILTAACLGAALLTGTAALAFESDAKQAVLIDMKTGTTLYNKNADERMGPSSMSKIMTVYLLFDRLKQGALKLDDQFFVSEKAWRMGGSEMFVKVGDYVKVEELLRGIIIQSGNDACIVVAEGLAGSEEAFATMMNTKAEELGLTGSHFANSTGWPDPNHYMTARDLATLSAAMIRDFPEYYHYWAEPEFTYQNIRQYNRNTLLGQLGIDGIKTGHTDDAGYGITIAGEKEGRRLIAVVNGLGSMSGRINSARNLINYGYTNFRNVEVLAPGAVVTSAQTWLGEKPQVALALKDSVVFSLPIMQADKVTMRATVKEPLPTPIQPGMQAGVLEVSAPGSEPQRYPLYTAEAVEKLSPFQRIIPVLKHRLLGSGGSGVEAQ